MPALSASASEKDGRVTITLANCDMRADQRVRLTAVGGTLAGRAAVTVLRHDDPHACNTFDAPETVVPAVTETTLAGGDAILVPAAGVVSVVIENG